MRVNFKKLGIIFMFVLLGVGLAMAQSTDELYERAINKYFLGDNEAAIQLLDQILEIDPLHARAEVLLEQIKNELEKNKPTVPIVTTTTVAAKTRVMTATTRVVSTTLPKQAAPVAPAPQPRPEPKNAKNTLMAAAGISLGLVVGWALIAFWFWAFWRAKHLYCNECGGRNDLDAEFCRKCGARLNIPDLTAEQAGWFSKFGWAKNPFTLNIMPDVYTGHKAEIAMIIEKLNTLSGHILVIGGLGTGKTTLLQWLEKNLKSKFETIYLIRPPARADELIDLVAATLSKKTNQTRKYSVYEFQTLCRNYKRNILLLLDEAHEFNQEFEQFLRTLGDLSNVHLLMAGLPQAREKLKRDLPALFDRIVETLLLGSLSLEETRDLILKRIKNAGGSGLGPFTALAVEQVYNLGYGIPRGILKICDWVVTQAVRANKTYIDTEDVEAFSREIRAARLPGLDQPKEALLSDE